MLLLHVSDIHFRAPNCTNPDLDPDRPYRTRMIRDVHTRSATLGPVEAILVGGDIAFKADPEEYKAALAWLTELAEAAGCPLARVFVVPGNHDVDRNMTASSPSTSNAQWAIKRADHHAREGMLRRQFTHPETGRALLAPLEAYNDFAKLFGCQVYSPDHLYWKQELSLGGDVKLRIYGLTSTLLSGVNGQDDTRDCLYLSPLQTVLDPVENVVNLVLCHHPPEWFMDHDDIHDAISGRAAVHLFGHKHRQRITPASTYIRFDAGAVNPDRNEIGWRPSYNFIRLEIEGSGSERFLSIEAHLLEWQSSPEQYRAVLTQNGEAMHQHRISMPSRTPAIIMMVNTTESVVAASVNAILEEELNVEAVMSNERTRNLVFRFWNLTLSQRRDIAFSLGLIEQSELSLPEPERYGRALRRAGERDLLDELVHKIDEVEKK